MHPVASRADALRPPNAGTFRSGTCACQALRGRSASRAGHAKAAYSLRGGAQGLRQFAVYFVGSRTTYNCSEITGVR
jgi:hypothetical protein